MVHYTSKHLRLDGTTRIEEFVNDFDTLIDDIWYARRAEITDVRGALAEKEKHNLQLQQELNKMRRQQLQQAAQIQQLHTLLGNSQ